MLSKWSKEQDNPSSRDNSARFKAVSGPGLILYAFTISFAAIDWIMSIDPSWISTIYGLLILIGELLSAMCFAVVVERILVNYKPMSELLKPDFVHDHGKWMLTFIMVWAYFSFSQWLIIWAGNLPEEITWYLRRLNGGWGFVGLVPRRISVRCALCPVAFASVQTRHTTLGLARGLDHDHALPRSFLDHRAQFLKDIDGLTLADIVVPIAIGGIWLAYFFRNLSSLPLLPAYDADANEVLEPAHD